MTKSQRVGKLISVVGTNASGKSSLGIELALRFAGEVVSADSRQVFVGGDLCSGKVSEHEAVLVPHHLVDIVPIGYPFSVAEYQSLAYRTIDDILERGKQPFLVGGTGLYVRSVVRAYVFVDAPPSPDRRAELESMSDEALKGVLMALVPESASALDARNRRRVIRAIEIAECGQSYPAAATRAEPVYDVLQIGLTWPPELLRERIDARLRSRLDQGMVDEVRGLLDAGVTYAQLDSLGLEYREIARFLRGEYADEEELFTMLRTAIYQFSRRQMKWFRKDEDIIWLDSSGDYVGEATRIVEQFLATDSSTGVRS